MSENTDTPDHTNPTAPTQAHEPAAPAAVPASGGKPAARRRTALIAGGATLGALLLAGGGVAIGAAVADDDDDDRLSGVVANPRDEGPNAATEGTAPDPDASQGGARTDDSSEDDSSEDADARTVSDDELGASSADELDSIAQAAQGVADGAPTAIDANRDGSWDVTLRGSDGSETEVLVGADGQAVARETEAADDDERAPRNVLDTKTLATMVDAALGEGQGRIIDIDADDDNRSPFDVTILTGDRRIVEVTLDPSGGVIKTEIED